MVESLRELDRICQKPRHKEVGNWMVRKILRPAALPLTWLLLHTSVTANQVTLAALIVGLLGVVLLAAVPSVFFLISVLLLQSWYLLDHVDGQIARYRKTSSLSGRFFDFLMHHLIHGLLPAGLAWYSYAVSGNLFWLALGFPAVVGMIFLNLIQDVKCKVFVEKIISNEAGPVQAAASSGETAETGAPSKAPLASAVSIAHKIAEMHVLMNLLTLAALFENFLWPGPWRFYFFVFYAVLVPGLVALKCFYWITRRKIDEEYLSLFRGRLRGED